MSSDPSVTENKTHNTSQEHGVAKSYTGPKFDVGFKFFNLISSLKLILLHNSYLNF